MAKQINPRLKSGESRIVNAHCLPEAIKDGLKAIAKSENKSVSRILEEVVIDYFGLRRPRYVSKKVVKK